MAQISLSKNEYEFDSLVKMAHRMGHFFSIEISANEDTWLLEWEVSEEFADESIKRVRNEIYEQIIRDKISAETKPIRDLIFAAAFSNIEIN